ncbi:MAG: thioredoxin domain-containing protein [Bacteroidia bacterium]
MKIIQYLIFFILFILLTINFSWCQSNGKNGIGGKLSAQEFEQKINSEISEQIIDVRTPEEFSQGFIKNAVNIDWNAGNFENQVSKLNKSKPVFVYCLAGGRSAGAAIKLKELGFNTIYDLKGGMNAWRNASKPVQLVENMPIIEKKGISLADFKQKINVKGLVMVDVFAPWCGPCKKMAPYLEEIATERKANLNFLKIDNDDNQEIVKFLFVDELPTIILYKNGNRVYTNIGLITKEDLLRVIDSNSDK